MSTDLVKAMLSGKSSSPTQMACSSTILFFFIALVSPPKPLYSKHTQHVLVCLDLLYCNKHIEYVVICLRYLLHFLQVHLKQHESLNPPTNQTSLQRGTVEEHWQSRTSHTMRSGQILSSFDCYFLLLPHFSQLASEVQTSLALTRDSAIFSRLEHT